MSELRATVLHGNEVKLVAYDRGSSRYLVEYISNARLLEYPFEATPGYREWVGPYAIETIMRPESTR